MAGKGKGNFGSKKAMPMKRMPMSMKKGGKAIVGDNPRERKDAGKDTPAGERRERKAGKKT